MSKEIVSHKHLIAGESGLAKIKSVLAKGVDPRRFVQVALMALNRPELAECSPISALQCVVDAASLGLDFAPVLGEAYAVPFKQEVKLIVGYQGLQKLAREADGVEIDADCVFRGDPYKVRRGTQPGIEHEYGPSPRIDDDEIIAVYAVAYKDGKMLKFVSMSVEQVEAVRKRSKQSNGATWKNTKDGGSYHEMARKTAVRRLSKFLPKSPDSRFVQALEREDEDFATEVEEAVGNRAENLTEKLKNKRAAPQAEDRTASDEDLALAEQIEAKRKQAQQAQAEADALEQGKPEPEAPKKKKATDQTPSLKLTTEEQPTSPVNLGVQRLDSLIAYVANKERIEVDEAETKVLTYLQKYKYEPSMLSDDGRWQIVWGSAQKRDWSK